MLDFFSLKLKLGSEESIRHTLQKLSENGKCLLSGDEGNLVCVPVDGDHINFMPYNIAMLSEGMAAELTYSISYTQKLGSFVVEFESPPLFMRYNAALLEMLPTTEEFQDRFEVAKHEKFVELYEYLSRKHVKGISKISNVHQGHTGEISMTTLQFRRYIAQCLQEAIQNQNTSKIITPDFGGLK